MVPYAAVSDRWWLCLEHPVRRGFFHIRFLARASGKRRGSVWVGEKRGEIGSDLFRAARRLALSASSASIASCGRGDLPKSPTAFFLVSSCQARPQ